MKKRVILFALTVVLAITAIGCGGEQSTTGTADGANTPELLGIFTDWIEQTEAKLTDEPVTFTYWVRNDNAGVVSNYAEHSVYKTLQERTGVTIEFLHPTGDQNQLDMLIAAGATPDFIETVNMNSIPEGADKAIANGVIIRLNELVEQYAPNFMRGRSLSDESRRLTSTDMGNIYGFPKLLGGYEGSWGGPSIREDLLEKLNLDPPETFDEWYEVLTAFKNDGIEIPLSLPHAGWDTVNEFGVFIGGFDVAKGFFVKQDGTVAYGPIEDGYKRFLQTFHKWYEEGLIYADFDSIGRNEKSTLAAEGKIGAAVDIGFGDYTTVAVPYPVEEKGTEARFRQKNWRNRGYEATISTNCADPVLAVKWFDYHYSPAGSRLFSMGVEGDSYVIVDNEYVYTPTIYNSADGIGRAMQSRRLVNAPYLTNPEATPLQLPKELREETSSIRIWEGPTDGMLPRLTMTDEEREEYNEIMDAVSSFVSPKYVSFIKGTDSLDQWDEYVRTIKNMNIDRAIEITQTAYNRLMAR
ncbi:MAG: extracellular solute-binding protein [Clostridia bacterium]|nr:extracellular solute-binding protein [Clostridia bacterium]